MVDKVRYAMTVNGYHRTVIFLLIFLTQETCPCDIHTCFKWKISKNRLTLTCKVDDLHFSIFFYDPFGNVQADCVQPYPSVKCEPYYKNGSITQNSTTNETIFTVRGKIDKSINGNWTCRHGHQKDIARVEVTVLNIAGELGDGTNKENLKYKNNTYSSPDTTDETLQSSKGNQCIYKVLLFSMIAYFGAMLVWILVWCKAGEYVKPRVDDIWQKCKCITKIQVWKTVCFLICTSLFFGICTVCGLIDDAKCTSGIILPITGCVFGCVSTPFFLNLAVQQSNMAANTVNASANGHDEHMLHPMMIHTND